jgi:hypothetical protein
VANLIKIKRGLKANLPVLAEGELAFCTDTNELYIGTSGGNVLINGDAPNVLIQFSPDNANWHTDYQQGDAYVRFSNDNGVTWTNGVPVAVNADTVDGYHASDFLDLTSNQTIGGEKTFLVTPIVPVTPTSTDDNRIPSIGYVKTLITSGGTTPFEYTPTLTLLSTAPQVYSMFGIAVALSADGSIMAVGASGWDGTYTNQGKVYIYDWNGSTWVERSQIVSPTPAASEWFGEALTLSPDGTKLFVGARGYNSSRGKVYIFEWNTNSWVNTGSIIAPDAGIADNFGTRCAISGDGTVLAISAYGWDGTTDNIGAVYIYDWNGSSWVYRNTIASPYTLEAYAMFGSGLALSSDGSILAVGIEKYDDTYNSQGGVYIFEWDGSTWSQSALITASDATNNVYFGSSCALSPDGNYLYVGASGANSNHGALYIFQKSIDTWAEVDVLTSGDDTQTSENFGRSCAVSSDKSLLVVGASGYQSESGFIGAIYMFNRA